MGFLLSLLSALTAALASFGSRSDEPSEDLQPNQVGNDVGGGAPTEAPDPTPNEASDDISEDEPQVQPAPSAEPEGNDAPTTDDADPVAEDADPVVEQPVEDAGPVIEDTVPVIGDAEPDMGGNGAGHGMGSDGGHSPGHAHGNMNFPAAPGAGASQAAIQAYLGALAAQTEEHVHEPGSDLMAEHMAFLDLAPRDAASHVAIGSGDWDDPAIWSGGTVPGDDATVLIPQGVTVSYGTVSDAELFTLRIDGKLEFETSTDSKLVFDTMLVSPSGHLEIGTADQPVDPAVSIELVVADNGAIDTNWDPMLLSRGIVSHGKTDIHGAVKDSHEKVVEDPMAGETSVSFAEIPEGWQVGDTIVIAGTRYEGYKWDNAIRAVRHYESEDEVRVISNIDGNTVEFEEPLEFNHDSPRSDLKTSVANYTRNVSVESESGAESEVFARGHVMFMHSDEVDVRYAEFHELGRTDKSVEAKAVSRFDSIESDSNIQGRYSLHLHRTGVDDLDNPTILEGNAVFGSPGWGVVHHDANAVIENNATFDTFGAGYVAETGNETGVWHDNIAIYATGIQWGNPKNAVNLTEFDLANSGDGFWFQGRLVDATDNVAASVNNGYAYFHRDSSGSMIRPDAETFAYAEALAGETSAVDDVPITGFSGNETIAGNNGLIVVKANPNQGHDVWSHLEDFTAWSVRTGAHIEYTSHYVLTDFDVVGKAPTQFSPARTGISIGNNTTEVVVVDSKVTGFPVGFNLQKNLVGRDDNPSIHDFVLVNPTTIDVDQLYENYDPLHDTIISDQDVTGITPTLQLDGPLTYKEGYPDPDARHVDITGTKTDSLGMSDLPGGTDNFDIGMRTVIHLLEEKGYWTTSEGQNYFLKDIFFTDRLTGDVYVETHPVYIDDNVRLGNQFFSYRDAVDNGVQDIVELPDGSLAAGEVILGVSELAVPFAHLGEQDAAAGAHMSMAEMTPEMELISLLDAGMSPPSDDEVPGEPQDDEVILL